MRKNQRVSPQQKSTKANNDGFIRIISGQWRARKLPVKDKQGLRPTSDRTKETLFNWLMHDVRDKVCLDCFSGSGSLGFEALSRYSQFCTFLEFDASIAKQLQINLKHLKISNAEVIQGDTLKLLAQAAQRQYNLVFIDPPFNQGLAEPCIKQLESNGYLAEGCLIYVEVEKSLSLTLPTNWTLLKQKTSSQTLYQLYCRD